MTPLATPPVERGGGEGVQGGAPLPGPSAQGGLGWKNCRLFLSASCFHVQLSPLIGVWGSSTGTNHLSHGLGRTGLGYCLLTGQCQSLRITQKWF